MRLFRQKNVKTDEMPTEPVILNEDGSPNYLELKARVDIQPGSYLHEALCILYTKNADVNRSIQKVPYKKYSSVVDLYKRLCRLDWKEFMESGDYKAAADATESFISTCTDEELREALHKVYKIYMEECSKDFIYKVRELFNKNIGE